MENTENYLNNSASRWNSSSMEEMMAKNLTGEFLQVISSEVGLNYSRLNDTTNTPDWREAYKIAMDFLTVFLLIVIMLSMGCGITWRHLCDHIKRPVGFLIGIFSQFVIMPLSAYSILKLTGISGLPATGILIISCCPGGVLSNTFTYFCEGDLELSIAMTFASTVLAMGMMPLNIWLYGRSFEADDVIVPHSKMAMSLVSVTSPVLVGMVLKWKVPKIAAYTTKLGSCGGIMIMFVFSIVEVLLFPNIFLEVPTALYATVLSLPIIGLTLGYALAALMTQSSKVRKTISIECGVQNVPVALTIIAMSFPLEMQGELLFLPWLYGFATVTGCTVICLTYHFWIKYSQSLQDKANDDFVMKQVQLLNGEDEIGVTVKIYSDPATPKLIQNNETDFVQNDVYC